MNNIRVLRWSNLLLLLTGYQMHWFDKKTQTYRISLGWVINVLCLACTYVACFVEHFQPLPVLKVMQDASPFLYGLMRMQLFLGAKAFCYAIYASWRAVGVANDLTESLPALSSNETRRRWPLEAMVAYFLLLSTNFTLFFFCLYIGYEMDFELPPLKEAMIGTALFMPHLILAGSLRFYCILAWITRSRLRQLKEQLEELLSSSPAKTELELVGGTALAMSSIAPPDTDGMQCLGEQLQQLGTRFGACFDSLQRSLLLLLGLNGNGLLFGIYANVYYHSTWHLLFNGRSHRVFLASNALIFACIACDYLCLLLVQSCLERQRQHFLDKLNSALSQRSILSKHLRSILKDMRCTLWNTFRCKFLSIWRFDFANFWLLIVLKLLVIALIVMYHYLNDAIMQINDNLASSDDE